MKKNLVIFSALFLMANHAFAQKHEVGVRFGYDWGFTYQYNFDAGYSIDVGINFPGKAIYPAPKFSSINQMPSTPWHLGCFGTQFMGFFLWNFDTPVDGLSWYVGPGIYQGFAARSYKDLKGNKEVESTYMGSFNGKIGVKYMLPFAPIAFTFDWAPGIAMSDDDIYGQFDNQLAFAWWTFGAGIRFLF